MFVLGSWVITEKCFGEKTGRSWTKKRDQEKKEENEVLIYFIQPCTHVKSGYEEGGLHSLNFIFIGRNTILPQSFRDCITVYQGWPSCCWNRMHIYMHFQANFRPNLIQVGKMCFGRYLVNLIITFWRRLFLHKYNYFSSFGAGNCVSNSSFKRMKNILTILQHKS